MANDDLETQASRDADRLAAANAEYGALRPASETMPIRFPGGAVVNEISYRCNQCSTEFPQSDLRLRAVRLTPTVVTFDGWGGCRICRLLMKLNFRIRSISEGQIVLEWQDKDLGWVSTTFAPTLWRRLSNSLNPLTLRKRLQRHRGKAGLQEALVKASGKAARDILGTGWTDALEAEFAGSGYSKLRLTDEDGDDAVSLLALNGKRVRLAMGIWHLGPAAKTLGPVNYEVQDAAS